MTWAPARGAEHHHQCSHQHVQGVTSTRLWRSRQFAADDKKKREEVDIRNGADQMVFQTEKMLKENGDKMPADVKTEAEAKLAELKTAVQSGSIDDIKAKQEALSHVFEKMYQGRFPAAGRWRSAKPGLMLARTTTSRSPTTTASWMRTSRKSKR